MTELASQAPSVPPELQQNVAAGGVWTELSHRVRGAVNDEWGRSESLDLDNVGDIADEGAGHRG